MWKEIRQRRTHLSTVISIRTKWNVMWKDNIYFFSVTYHELFGLRLILNCGRENVGGFNVHKINSKNDDAVYWHRVYSKMVAIERFNVFFAGREFGPRIDSVTEYVHTTILFCTTTKKLSTNFSNPQRIFKCSWRVRSLANLYARNKFINFQSKKRRQTSTTMTTNVRVKNEFFPQKSTRQTWTLFNSSCAVTSTSSFYCFRCGRLRDNARSCFQMDKMIFDNSYFS